MANSGNRELNQRMKNLEELINDQLSKKDVEIKQLQDKIKALEEQTEQQKIQIKDLQDKLIGKLEIQFQEEMRHS